MRLPYVRPRGKLALLREDERREGRRNEIREEAIAHGHAIADLQRRFRQHTAPAAALPERAASPPVLSGELAYAIADVCRG